MPSFSDYKRKQSLKERCSGYKFIVDTFNDPLLSQSPLIIHLHPSFLDWICKGDVGGTDPTLNKRLEELYANYP
jgi:hypothetical protein